MTSTKAPAAWSDSPYQLITIPTSQSTNVEHSCLGCAAEMANAHNVLIRGMNAIVQQAPHVTLAQEAGYQAKDVTDLLFYVRAWCKMVNHHHDTEESCIFPEIEKVCATPGLFNGALEQHEQFHAGMDQLLAYATETAPEKFTWDGTGGMKAIIDGFGGLLVAHLHEEIEIFLGLTHLDSKSLNEAWIKGEKYAANTGNLGMLYDVFPCVLGNADKTFDGSQNFPPLPWFLPYAVKFYFALGNGAWRFNTCTWFGQPQPPFHKR